MPCDCWPSSGISPRHPPSSGWTSWSKAILSPEDAAFYRAGFETLMMFRIRENLKRVSAGQPPDNTLDPQNALDKSETLLLKDALSAVAQLQKRISKGFHVPWMNYFGQ
jgi:signal-transduction protein with cAMP-binding, CBS, and nucleotidyltransferase domain